MAHADYDCCAICDSQIQYVTYLNATTKNIVCNGCIKSLFLHHGIDISDIEPLKQWIKINNKERVKNVLKDIGYSECYYKNDIDNLIKELKIFEE